MIKFKNKKTGEIKNAYSLRETEDRLYIKFTADGKEYGYLKNNIQILNTPQAQLMCSVYAYTKECYRCHMPTEILTYITYRESPNEDVVYPYDFDRLIRSQNIVAHLQDPTIEYYGINVVGDIEDFDRILAEEYPARIKEVYSGTQKRNYLMNVCEHCGKGQGWYYVYRDINTLIKNKTPIKMFKEKGNSISQCAQFENHPT